MGVELDERMSWENHIDTICRKVGSGEACSKRMQKLQNRAARIMTGANYDVRSTDLLHAMSWKNLNDRHKMNQLVLMFKILNNHSAPNLKDKFITRDTKLNNYNPRNADINFSVPKPRTEYLKKDIVGLCFGYSGAVLLNSLPTQAKQTESLSSFKNLIK